MNESSITKIIQDLQNNVQDEDESKLIEYQNLMTATKLSIFQANKCPILFSKKNIW